MRLESREVWTKDINLGVISVEMLFKAMKLDEITQGMGVDGKEEGLKTEPRGHETLSFEAAISENTFENPKAYIKNSLMGPTVT